MALSAPITRSENQMEILVLTAGADPDRRVVGLHRRFTREFPFDFGAGYRCRAIRLAIGAAGKFSAKRVSGWDFFIN